MLRPMRKKNPGALSKARAHMSYKQSPSGPSPRVSMRVRRRDLPKMSDESSEEEGGISMKCGKVPPCLMHIISLVQDSPTI